MKITKEEILWLQDITGNSSLALKYIHSHINEIIDENILLEIARIGVNLTKISESVLKTHKPLSFGRRS